MLVKGQNFTEGNIMVSSVSNNLKNTSSPVQAEQEILEIEEEKSDDMHFIH